MKKIMISALLLASGIIPVLSSCNQKPSAQSQATIADTVQKTDSKPALEAKEELDTMVVVTSGDKTKIETLLQEAVKAGKKQPGEWMLYFAHKFDGVPYIGGTLDRAQEEKLVVNLTELDCTTFVEQVAALAMSAERGETSFADFCNHLKHIRYIDGEIEYAKRQHYFTAWIDDNVKEGIVDDIQGPNPPFTAVQLVRVDWMTTHQSSYKMLKAHPEWSKGIRQLEQSISGRKWRYIPKTDIYNTKLMRQTIKNGDIIVILTNKKGLDTTHIGLASWHTDGLHLLNASAIHKKVIDEPMTLRTYMSKHPVQIGIRVCRMR